MKRNKILILGAGLVAKPCVRYLLNIQDFKIGLADADYQKAMHIIGDSSNGKAYKIDASDVVELKKIISEYDIIVSLLPWTLHPIIAEISLKLNKHMFTASYASEALKKFDKEAKSKELLFMNELGLDPGLDHLSTMKIEKEVENKGGKIISYKSFCGGLPHPKHNNNPFGYKFSWSPKGVLLASKNSARFYKEGVETFIDSKDLFSNFELDYVEDLGVYEVYPNRDSTPYKNLYGLNDAKTLIRGTYRNLGWCSTINKMKELGLLDDDVKVFPDSFTYRDLMKYLLKVDRDDNLIENLADRLGVPKNSEIIGRLMWLGLLDDVKVPNYNNCLDIICDLMTKKLKYESDETDMALMKHEFIIEYSDGKKERRISALINYGIIGGETAMARTVSLPLAIGIKLFAEGKAEDVGVQIPLAEKWFKPILEELERYDIKFEEKSILL